MLDASKPVLLQLEYQKRPDSAPLPQPKRRKRLDPQQALTLARVFIFVALALPFGAFMLAASRSGTSVQPTPAAPLRAAAIVPRQSDPMRDAAISTPSRIPSPAPFSDLVRPQPTILAAGVDMTDARVDLHATSLPPLISTSSVEPSSVPALRPALPNVRVAAIDAGPSPAGARPPMDTGRTLLLRDERTKPAATEVAPPAEAMAKPRKPAAPVAEPDEDEEEVRPRRRSASAAQAARRSERRQRGADVPAMISGSLKRTAHGARRFFNRIF